MYRSKRDPITIDSTATNVKTHEVFEPRFLLPFFKFAERIKNDMLHPDNIGATVAGATVAEYLTTPKEQRNILNAAADGMINIFIGLLFLYGFQCILNAFIGILNVGLWIIQAIIYLLDCIFVSYEGPHQKEVEQYGVFGYLYAEIRDRKKKLP